MITLAWSYILIGWVVFITLGLMAELSIGNGGRPWPSFFSSVFVVALLMLFVSTFLAIFSDVAQLIQPYIIVTW